MRHCGFAFFSLSCLANVFSRPTLALELASSSSSSSASSSSSSLLTSSSSSSSSSAASSAAAAAAAAAAASSAASSSSLADLQAEASSSSSLDDFKPLAQSVVELLDTLAKQLEADQKKDDKAFKVHEQFVKKETKRLNGEIADSKEEIDTANSGMQEQLAQVSSKQTKLEKVANELSKAEKELVDAKDVRAAEQATFKKNEGELLTGIDQFKRSLEVIHKKLPKSSLLETSNTGDEDDDGMSFEDGPLDGPGLLQAAQNLRSTLSGARDLNLSPDDRETLMHFVRSASDLVKEASKSKDATKNAEGSEPDVSFLQTNSQRAATQTQVPGHMQSVIQTLKGVLTKTKAQLQAIREDEKKAVSDFKPLKVSLEDGIASKKKMMNTLKLEIPQHSQKSSELNSTLLSEQEKLKTAKEALAQLLQEHESTKAQHELQKKKRSDELLAVKEAKAILTSKESRQLLGTQGFLEAETAPSFVQVSKSASKLLLKHSETPSAPFANVKKMISRMLQKLEADQMADIKHSDWCGAEQKRSKASKKLRLRDVERASDHLSEINAAMVQNSELLAKSEKEKKDLEKSISQASKLRKSEAKDNEVAIAKYTKAVKLLKDAVAALKKFYGNKADAASTGYTASASGTQAINILEIASANFQDLLNTQKSSETTGQANFKKYMDESNIRKAVLDKDLEHKGRTGTKLKADRLRVAEDLKSYQKELEAVVSYETELDGSCGAKEVDYNSRAEQRKKEVEALQEALDYLLPKSTEA